MGESVSDFGGWRIHFHDKSDDRTSRSQGSRNGRRLLEALRGVVSEPIFGRKADGPEVRRGNLKFKGDRKTAFVRAFHAQDLADFYLFRSWVGKKHFLAATHFHSEVQEAAMRIDNASLSFHADAFAIRQCRGYGYGNAQYDALASAAVLFVGGSEGAIAG
jgi:hypothetical protein